MRLGTFELDLIQDGLFSLPPDAALGDLPSQRQRILVGMNCLLVRTRDQVVLIDAGVGSKPRHDFVKSYRMEWPRRLYSELERLHVPRDAIDDVILTHLHWDHAGGATRTSNSGVVVAFPRACYFVQRREWEEAMSAPAGGEGYLPEDFAVLREAGVLTMLDGDSEIFPGIKVRLTGGHTPGHQIVLVGNARSERAVFLADLVPTTALLSPEAAMIYDLDREALAREKQKILREAAENRWLLIFQHAPRLRAGYIMSAEGPVEWAAL